MGSPTMKSVMTAAALAFALSSLTAMAQGQSGAQPGQDEHLASCDADATAAKITGDARKSYISTCMSRKAGQANTNAAREKLKSCTAQAGEKNLVEAPRKAFIDNCVKGFVL
jgi:hypothetical protein